MGGSLGKWGRWAQVETYTVGHTNVAHKLTSFRGEGCVNTLHIGTRGLRWTTVQVNAVSADRSVDLGHKWLQRNGRLGSRLQGVGFRDKLEAEGVFCVLRMSFMWLFFFLKLRRQGICRV